MTRRALDPVLVGLFLVSGATSLVYQTVWARHLHLVLGTSTFAVSTVLGAFMAGLGWGGWWGGRCAPRVARPAQVYGVLEAGIAAWALVLPWLVEPVAGWGGGSGPLTGVGAASVAVRVGLLLLPPTVAMGATLPLLVAGQVEVDGRPGRDLGLLYGVNTLGAVLGAVLAGFLLLPALGVTATTWVAVAGNLGLAVVAVRRRPAGVEVPRPSEGPAPARWGIVMALAGTASLIGEVAWTRVLSLVLGPSVYAFSVMLVAYLVGIALGGMLGGVLADRLDRSDAGAKGVVAVELFVGIGSIALLGIVAELPFWYVWGFDALGASSDPALVWVLGLTLSGLVLVPPAIGIGAAFPLVTRVVARETGGLATATGGIYAAASWGGAVGAFVAGFVLLPTVGVRGALLVALGLNGAAAVLAGRHHPRWAAGAAALVGVAAFVAPAWDARAMTSGTYHYLARFTDHSREGIARSAVGDYDLKFYREGLSSVVTVGQNRETGNLWLANHGKIDASSQGDLPTQILVALLPMAHEPRGDVLVIGIASGISAGTASVVPGVERLTLVDIEPAIGDAARLFAEHNHGVLDDPKVEVVFDDARHLVRAAGPGRWDIVISEPSNPWISGVSNLFTREFWELGRSRLRPGGVWAQWMQVYGLSMDDLRTLLATFASVFPEVAVFASADLADIVVLGSDAPLPISFGAAEALARDHVVARELERAQLGHPTDLVGLMLMDGPAVRRLTEGMPLNTDDNLWIEYRAPLHLYDDSVERNLAMLAQAMEVPSLPDGDAQRWRGLAETYARWGHVGRAAVAMARARDATPPGTDAWYLADARARAWAEDATAR